MSKTRIYKIRNVELLDAHPPRLVEAVNQAAALRHVYKPFEASIPDTREVLDLVQNKGVVVETAA